MLNYGEVYTRLFYDTAIVTFFKKDGTHRVMLCTRNLDTAFIWHGNLGGLLAGHDKRCSIKNGNLAVVDLEIGQCRSFNIDRIIDIHWLGSINNSAVLEQVYNEYVSFKKRYMESVEGEDNKSMEDMTV